MVQAPVGINEQLTRPSKAPAATVSNALAARQGAREGCAQGVTLNTAKPGMLWKDSLNGWLASCAGHAADKALTIITSGLPVA